VNRPKAVGYCALATLFALYVVGFVNDEVLRHAVQTLPLWFSIVMGLRQRDVAKWMAIPCFIIWLILMSIIWLFLLGWTTIISGHFTPIEISLTVIIGAACIGGSIAAVRWKTDLSWIKGLSITATFAIFQMVTLRLSFLPFILKDG